MEEVDTQRRVLRTTIFIHHMRSLDGVVALEFHKCPRCAVFCKLTIQRKKDYFLRKQPMENVSIINIISTISFIFCYDMKKNC